jgi:hypothetical protein
VPTTDVKERLRRDLFPVEVTIGWQAIAQEARVVVTDSRVFVYQVNRADGGKSIVSGSWDLAVEVEADRANLIYSDRSGHLAIETTEGTMHVNRVRGCGCSSPLRIMDVGIPW